MKNIDTLKDKVCYNFKSLKDYDPVEYSGGESWKPKRDLALAGLTAKDVNLPENIYKDLKHFQESAWYFCDTIIMENNAENGYHYLDYALHGERMGWQRGDEYWLVVNLACGGRLELRKADPDKWTPLEKFYVNKNLNIKLKLYATVSLLSAVLHHTKRLPKNKIIIKKLGINSYPDRIELYPHTDLCNIMDVIEYYYHHSSFKYFENDFDLPKYYYSLAANENIKKELQKYKEAGGFNRRYNLYNENEVEDPEYYKNIFLKYCHDLHYRQKYLDKFLKEEEENGDN